MRPVLIAVALFCLPAWVQAQGVLQNIRGAGAQTQEMKNLKQLALAMHAYHDTNNHFPAAICDKDGKPLLSWRVAILPYINEQALYQQFKHDEPWDSEHNKKNLVRMPGLLRAATGEAGDSQTHYRVFVGPEKGGSALFRSYADKVRIQHITDGTSNTIMIAESADTVPWSKPEELPYAPSEALPKLRQTGNRGAAAVFCDGAVHSLSSNLSVATLRALITRDGGEVVQIDD